MQDRSITLANMTKKTLVMREIYVRLKSSESGSSLRKHQVYIDTKGNANVVNLMAAQHQPFLQAL